MEAQKRELRMQLREAKYVNLYRHVAASNLQKQDFNFSGIPEVYCNVMTKNWAQMSQNYNTDQMSRLVFG